jgi:hypothetical protein
MAAKSGREVKGGKKDKQRLSAVLCSNADGSFKMDPTFIGKAAEPGCLRGSKRWRKRYNYLNNKNAWMNEEAFLEWTQLFKDQIKAYKRKIGLPENAPVLLVMDNHKGHFIPKNHPVRPDWLDLLYLSPNTTSLVQPLDGGIIAVWKLRYRKRFVIYLHQWMSRHADKTLAQAIRSFNMKLAMDMSTEVWSELEPEIIKRVFDKTLINADPARLRPPGARQEHIVDEVAAVNAAIRLLDPDAAVEREPDVFNEGVFEEVRPHESEKTLEECIQAVLSPAPPPPSPPRKMTQCRFTTPSR